MYRTNKQQINDVLAFGMAIVFVGLMFGMVRSLLSSALKSETEDLMLLPQTERKTTPGNRHQHSIERVNRLVTVSRGGIKHSYETQVTLVNRRYAVRSNASFRGAQYDVYGRKVAWLVFDEINENRLVKGGFDTQKDALNFALGLHVSEQNLLTQVEIEGGEPVPTEYRYLTGWLREPLPEYSLLALPAVVPEAGERKIDAVLKQLKDGVESIQDSEKFRLFLSTMAKFHDYSIGNLILIALQKPDATHVAGFNTWKDLGRWVTKGTKGIAILAPVMPRRPTCPECGARIPKGARFCPECGVTIDDAGTEITPRRFMVVYVFDISQTEGKELPEFEVPVLTGEANEDLFHRVMALAGGEGLTVSFESRPQQSPDIKGQYSGRSIWVRPEEPRAQQLKTLLHEVAHHYSEGIFQIPRKDAETIAESAAFAVGAHFGFDTGVRSFPYVALWAQDKKVLEQNLGSVRRVATRIIEGIEHLRET